MIEPSNDLFTTIVDVRNTELSALWTRFNIHLLMNGGYLLAILGASDGSMLSASGKFAYLFGLVLTVVWLLAERAGRYTLHYRDKKICDFEDLYWKNTPLADFKFFRDTPAGFLNQSYVSIAVILVFATAWLFLLSSGHA